MTMKMTSTRADLGDGEGIGFVVSCSPVESVVIFSHTRTQIKSIQENSLFFFLSSIFK